MRRAKRIDKNTSSAMINAYSEAKSAVQLPETVELRDDLELVLWNQFTRARAPNDWREADLIVVSKIVRLESDIRKYQKALDDEGAIVKNPRGTQIENPLFRVIDTLQRQQLALMRNIALNQTDRDARTLNGQSKNIKRVRDTMEKLEGSFIAMPEPDDE